MRRKKLVAKKVVTKSKVNKPTVRSGLRWLDCKECGVDGAYCTYDIKAVTCSLCVAKQAAPPETPKHLRVTADEKRPRGWQFMKEYVSPSGKVYHKGKEVDESTRRTIRPNGSKENKGRASSKRGSAQRGITKRGRKPKSK